MLCVRICVYTYICVCMCAFNPHPLGAPGAFYQRKISQMQLKSNIHEPFHHNCSLLIWSFGIRRIPGTSFLSSPLSFNPLNPQPYQLYGKTFCKKIPLSHGHSNHIPHQVACAYPLARSLSFLSLSCFFFFSFLSCIRIRLHLWLAGCELSAH